MARRSVLWSSPWKCPTANTSIICTSCGAERRDALQAFLKERGIGSLIHYPVPVHLQPAYRGRLGDVGSLPETERAAREVLSLPMFPELTEAEVRQVAEAVREFPRLKLPGGSMTSRAKCPMNLRTRKTLLIAAALLCITALAAAVRLYQIDRLPPGLSLDEALNNLLALRTRTLLPPPVFYPTRFGQEPAHMILIAFLYRLAGHPFAEGGRLASALAGIFAVFMLFFTAREIFRQDDGDDAVGIGLLSAGVLAILYWHVHYSRLGMEPPMVPALSVPAFYLFWRALNRQRWPCSFWLARRSACVCTLTWPVTYCLWLLFSFGCGAGPQFPTRSRLNGGVHWCGQSGPSSSMRLIWPSSS